MIDHGALAHSGNHTCTRFPVFRDEVSPITGDEILPGFRRNMRVEARLAVMSLHMDQDIPVPPGIA